MCTAGWLSEHGPKYEPGPKMLAWTKNGSQRLQRIPSRVFCWPGMSDDGCRNRSMTEHCPTVHLRLIYSYVEIATSVREYWRRLEVVEPYPLANIKGTVTRAILLKPHLRT